VKNHEEQPLNQKVHQTSRSDVLLGLGAAAATFAFSGNTMA